MNHTKAALQIIADILRDRPILREGRPLRLWKHGGGKYSLAADGCTATDAPFKASADEIIAWVRAEVVR